MESLCREPSFVKKYIKRAVEFGETLKMAVQTGDMVRSNTLRTFKRICCITIGNFMMVK